MSGGCCNEVYIVSNVVVYILCGSSAVAAVEEVAGVFIGVAVIVFIKDIAALIRSLMAPAVAAVSRDIIVKIHIRDGTALLPYLKAGVRVFGYVSVKFHVVEGPGALNLCGPAAVVYLSCVAVADSIVIA